MKELVNNWLHFFLKRTQFWSAFSGQSLIFVEIWADESRNPSTDDVKSQHVSHVSINPVRITNGSITLNNKQITMFNLHFLLTQMLLQLLHLHYLISTCWSQHLINYSSLWFNKDHKWTVVHHCSLLARFDEIPESWWELN